MGAIASFIKSHQTILGIIVTGIGFLPEEIDDGQGRGSANVLDLPQQLPRSRGVTELSVCAEYLRISTCDGFGYPGPHDPLTVDLVTDDALFDFKKIPSHDRSMNFSFGLFVGCDATVTNSGSRRSTRLHQDV